MTALEVRGLGVSYGRQEVLRGVDLTVESGVTAILGSSGCGKTTLLRAVAGFVTPTTGSVKIAGSRVVGGPRAVPARRRGVGYVPQEGALFPHLTVAANIAFGLPRHERRRSAAQVAEVLEVVELPAELADRYPAQLSGGQQQRVALARALLPRPSLVLLDEPFSSLDAGLREETGRAVVRALRSRGAAAVIVTHDQGEALSLADQVAVMSDGSFLQVGSPSQVYLAPADLRVARFLGHSVLLAGTVGGGTGTATCALGGVTLATPVAPGAATLVIRAEQVQVLAEPGAGTAGKVVDISFFGHDATVRVELDSGDHVIARTPAEAVPLPGQHVWLRVVGDVVAFAEGPGS